ncbi:MAG: right-handed parallel beta-helix repeat-containing protein, partial [Bacteroidaceae bacterium]|nr:right-handed parallel beta-helix repeat-containing protein [Bacteroidaceae bacterium]
HGITIEDNTFRVFDPRILYLYSVDGLTFRNNRIEMTTDYPYLRGVTEHFRVLDDCKNINIQE